MAKAYKFKCAEFAVERVAESEDYSGEVERLAAAKEWDQVVDALERAGGILTDTANELIAAKFTDKGLNEHLEAQRKMYESNAENAVGGARAPRTVRDKCRALLAEVLADAVANIPECKNCSDTWTLEDIAFTLQKTSEELDELAVKIENADYSEESLAALYDKEQKEKQEATKRSMAAMAERKKRSPKKKPKR